MTNDYPCQEQTSVPGRWYDRWLELDAVLLAKATTYQSVPLPSGQQNFGDLFKVLREFGGRQFCHFYEGLGPAGAFLQEDPVEAPRDYVFAVTLDQISNDLHVIERAANQHQADSAAFDTARRLAQHALGPVVGAGKLLAEMPIVIPYFQKSASIRIVPYADVVLIGLPLTAARVGRDYLVIPHEVGHYVYWRGRSSGQPIYRVYNAAISGSLDSVKRRWAEEIFADTYGCMVGGPIIALSSQDLANQRSLSGFTADDNEHPKPALRPFIYTKVLEKISQAQENQILADSSHELKEAWEDRLGKRGNPPILPDEFNTVYDVVDQALNILDPYVPLTRWSDDDVDILKPPPNETEIDRSKVEDEYTTFVGNIANLVPGTFTQAILPDPSSVWNDWAIRENFYDPFPPELPPAPPVPPGLKIDLAQTPTNKWLYVLHSGGWTTEIGNHEGG